MRGELLGQRQSQRGEARPWRPDRGDSPCKGDSVAQSPMITILPLIPSSAVWVSMILADAWAALNGAVRFAAIRASIS